jgi:hypothetical protein
VLARSGVKFVVFAPRAGHVDRVLILRYLNKSRDRMFVVAPDEMYALEVALSCPPGRLVRYTWDDELKDGFAMYRLEGKGFAVDTAFRVAEKILARSAQGS